MPLTTPPDQPQSDDPVGLVLHRRLQSQREHLLEADAALRRGDPHGLHDLRVAMRRLRTALATFRPLVDRAVTEPLRDELRWASGELGTARDREVVAERISGLLEREPVELVLGPVAARIEHALLGSHIGGEDVVMATLGSDRYAELLRSLAAVADDPPFTALADGAARELVARRFRRDLNRVLVRAEDALATTGEGRRAEALHEVRKATKRLRYAAEAAGSVGPPRVGRIEKIAKRLQIVLGDHHDTVGTRAALRLLAVRAHADGDSSFTFGRLHALEQADAQRLEAEAADLFRALDRSRKPRRAANAQPPLSAS